MTDQNKNNNSNNGKKPFFDVSFDDPLDDYSKRPSDPSKSKSQKQNAPSKWDNFYQDYKNVEKENYSNAEEIIQEKKPAANSFLSQSKRKVQDILNEMSQADSVDYSKFKSAKARDLKEREELASLYSRSKEKKPDKAKTEIEKEPEVEDDTSESNQSAQAASDDRYYDYQSDKIPTPEELRKIREERRRRRVEELERMTSHDEIVNSYYSALTPPPENKKSVESDSEDESETSQDSIHSLLASKQDDSDSPDSEFIPIDIALTDVMANVENDSEIQETTESDNPLDQIQEIDSSESQDPDLAALPLSTQRRKRKRKKEKADKKPMATSILAEASTQEKVAFGFNITFNVIKRLISYAIIVLILLGALAGGAGIGYFANLVSSTPPPTQTEMAQQINHFEQQSSIYYASGEKIADIRSDVVRSYADLDEISEYIIDGLIATEDEHFLEHPGIVPKAILRAVLETVFVGGGTGGSTLTQQLVKQQMLSNDVTFFRKANEILLALRLENYFSKEEILTAYLNVSPFGRNNNGDNVAGIKKAAEGIFGKSPADVSLNQAAFLVGLPQDPYIYTPYTQTGEFRSEENFEAGIERMKEVLYRMYRTEKITKEEYEEAIAYDITDDFIQPEPREEERQSYLYQAMMHGAIEKLMLMNIADDGYAWQQVYDDYEWYNEYYFAAENQLRTGGYKVYTTIDKQIYDQLQVSAKEYEDELGVTYDGVYVDPETGYETYYVEKVQTGLVMMENTTGRVLGFVAGTDFENNQIDHAFQMRRSPGSTIKPLAVYGPAVEHNLINPSTLIPDTAFVETYEDGSTWQPTNYGSSMSNTLMTARTALLRSDNLPAVRIYEELLDQGIPIIDYMEAMGFNTVDSYTESDTLNLAFSLGGVTTGPTVFEETRAFSTFANNGQYVDGYYIERIEDPFGNVVFQQDAPPRKVFSEDTNYIMLDMLRDTMTEGTGRTAREYLEIPGDWIAKTGISENSKDIWVIASTPAITVGSWIGYDSRYADYTIDVNDGFGLESVRSQIYWSRILNDIYAIRPEIFGTDLQFQQPDSVREETILTQTGTLPGTTTYNGQTYNLTGPTTTDLFKVSNPAPALTADFIFNGTEDDTARFWAGVASQEAILRQQQQQQQQQQQSSSESSTEDESSDESQGENPETPPGESTDPTPPSESQSSE